MKTKAPKIIPTMKRRVLAERARQERLAKTKTITYSQHIAVVKRMELARQVEVRSWREAYDRMTDAYNEVRAKLAVHEKLPAFMGKPRVEKLRHYRCNNENCTKRTFHRTAIDAKQYCPECGSTACVTSTRKRKSEGHL